MARYACPNCAEVFDTAGHPDPDRLTCFNCHQRADEPGYGYDRTQDLPPPLEPQTWYSVDEAARYLRFPREIIYRLIIKGHLTAYKAAGRGNERLARQDLDALMQKIEIPQKTRIDTRKSVFLSPAMADLWDNETDAIYDFY